MPEPALFVVKGITAGYGGTPVIMDVSLSVSAGEIAAVVGPNGAGKSTLMKAIVGVIRSTTGSITLDSVDVLGLPPDKLVQRGVSYVPQVANVFPSLSVVENLRMGAYRRKGSWRERADEMGAMFPDLKAAWGRAAKTLSGGQRTMLAMARALMLDPRILLLDEPSAGLSPRMEAAVWEHILAIKAAGVGVLVVEQNTRRALSHCDRGYVMVEGRNRLEGTGAELVNDEEIADLYIGRAG